MKNSLILSASIILLVGCEKERINLNSTDNKNSVTSSSNNSSISTVAKQKSWGICCIWNGVNACVAPPVNCFDEVIVTPKDAVAKAAKTRLDAVAASKSSDEVTKFFLSSDVDILFPGLKSEENKSYLAKLQSGNYYIVKINGQGLRSFYLVIPNGSKVEEFVLVVKEVGQPD